MGLYDLIAGHTSTVFFNENRLGKSGTVTRGGDSLTVTVVPMAWEAAVQGNDGMIVRQKLQQMLIQASDYTFGNNIQAYPAIGDVLQVDGVSYEVYRPNGADHSYEWEDQERTVFRVHVREVA